jgi:hypothetical protein
VRGIGFRASVSKGFLTSHGCDAIRQTGTKAGAGETCAACKVSAGENSKAVSQKNGLKIEAGFKIQDNI